MQDDISSSERVSLKKDILSSYEEAPYDLYNITEEEYVYDRFLASHYHTIGLDLKKRGYESKNCCFAQ